MAHFALHIFAVILILSAGWALFVIWVFGMIFRGLAIGFSRLTGLGNRRPVTLHTQRCPGFRCAAANPVTANFCRRCGSSLSRPAMKRQSFNSAAGNRLASSPISL
jgi:ribosomal protein L40E